MKRDERREKTTLRLVAKTASPRTSGTKRGTTVIMSRALEGLNHVLRMLLSTHSGIVRSSMLIARTQQSNDVFHKAQYL